mmetsp:Transcript_14891/g.41856  ORF Transcript_14891/g.41856 Transcript_14891/m.41856 type:complete len:372 (+) Transcript_14891:167-1282(+)
MGSSTAKTGSGTWVLAVLAAAVCSVALAQPERDGIPQRWQPERQHEHAQIPEIVRDAVARSSQLNRLNKESAYSLTDYDTPVRPLLPNTEAKECLSLLARRASPFPQRVTQNHVPRAYNIMDRKYFYKGAGIPHAFKTPCFQKCALVGSSGVMRHSKWGRVIDTFPAVIRLNNAPTYRHESDVGRRTTVRIMHDGHIHEKNLAELLRMDPGGVALVWPPTHKPKGLAGPGPKPDKTRHLGMWLDYSNATIMLTRFSKAGFYDSHMMARKVVAPYPPHVPSTGWNAMFASLHMCAELHVFGYAWELAPETFVRAGHKEIGKAYYWYKHEKGDVTETDYYYNRNIKNPNSVHGFAEEKQGYRNLAKIYNITFH